MKAVVAAFNQEKALVGAYSVITNLRMELFEALVGWRLFKYHDIGRIMPLLRQGGGGHTNCDKKVTNGKLQENDEAKVIKYIEDLLPLLEHSDFIAKYSWFLSRYYEVYKLN